MRFFRPEIGNWFQDKETGDFFEIVALDELNNTIEIQFLDGSISEVDWEAWRHMPMEEAAPPEDANAGYEIASEERINDSDGLVPAPLNPLTMIEGENFQGTDEY